MVDVQLSAQGGVIKTAYEAEADTNAFTDAEQAKIEIFSSTYTGTTTAGQTSAQRITNGTLLQDAINTAAAAGAVFILPAGVYEIELAGGLIIPEGYTGFEWRGSRLGTNGNYSSTKIVQYADNTPVLTVGALSDNSYTMIIDGVDLSYGNSQVGFTSSYTLKIQQTWRSQFRNISAKGGYINCLIDGGGFYFQNTMEHCLFGHGEKHSLAIQNFGTGNIWRDLYLGGGAPTATTISGSVLYMFAGGSAQHENIFEQVNMEWAKCTNALYMHTCRNMSFISTHFEGNELSGSYPSLIYSENCYTNFTGLTMLENKIKTANITAGTPALFLDGFNSSYNINGLMLEWDGVSVDKNFNIFSRGGYLSSDYPTMISAKNINIIDGASGTPNIPYLNLSNKLNISDYANNYINRINKFTQLEFNPEIEEAKISITGDYTVYGHIKNSMIYSPTALSADRTITLSQNRGAVGNAMAGVNAAIDNLISVHRGSGTAAFDILVKDGLGNLLSTISASNTVEWFFFDGSNWSKI